MSATEDTAQGQGDQIYADAGFAQESEQPRFSYTITLGILVACIVISVVDLAFLSDVVGQILGIGYLPAWGISAVLGLAGVFFMGHLGFKEAEEIAEVSAGTKALHIGIWLALGISFSVARFFSAQILDLEQFEDVQLVSVFGMHVSQSDVIFAPIMFVLYLMAGIGAKEAVHSLMLNPEFHDVRDKKKLRKADENSEKDSAKKAAKAEIMAKKAAARAEQERIKNERREIQAEKTADKRAIAAKQAELEKQRLENELATAEAVQAVQVEAAKEAEVERLERAKVEEVNALEKRSKDESLQVYYDAVQRYKQLESKFSQTYNETSSLLAEVEKIDAEVAALNKAFANVVEMISKAERGSQQQVALLVHGKTGAPTAELTATIAAYNAKESS